MLETEYRVTMDLHRAGSQAYLRLKQGSSGYTVRVRLTQGGRPYEVEADTSVLLAVRLPDGTVVTAPAALREGEIGFSIPRMVAESVGTSACELLLSAGKERITSPSFWILTDGVVYHNTGEVTAV